MRTTSNLMIAALAIALLPMNACDNRGTERWATTENTNVPLDWDKVNEAYKQATGPEDLEKRLNEIYEGDELISVAVSDQDDKTQVVTGFFDKNKSGSVDEGEKIFTIQRTPTAEGANVQTTGYGPYAGYHSPMMSIVSGMLLGSMISSMWAPRYVPMAYVTSSARMGDLHNQRTAHRAANPAKYGPTSRSGRNYGTKPSTPSRSTGRSGGGRFGLARRGRTVRPQRLTD